MTQFSFKMPDIGEGVVEGEIVSWLKKEGDAVAKDEAVVVLMTDKATVELPTPYPGKLVKRYYKVGEIAKKDLPLFDIETDSKIHETNEKKSAPAYLVDSVPAAPQPQIPPSKPKTAIKALAAPPVRKLARDLGININQVAGSGPEGRVMRNDIQHFHGAINALPQSPRPETETAALIKSTTPITRLAGDTEAPILGIKNLMAQKMVESSTIVPHFSFFDQADATRLVSLREKMRPEALVKKNIKLTFMPFFIKALSLCIKRHPTLNSSVDPKKNTLILHNRHNIGIAMSSPLGLIVPVLKNVEEMELFDVIYAYEALKEKAKSNKLSPSDMKEATITITNFGALAGGGVFATPIINYPEVAILGVARIQKQPIAVNSEIALREILNCSWSFDHRVIDGDLAAETSADFVTLIENPAKLL